MRPTPPPLRGGKRAGAGRPPDSIREKCQEIIDKNQLLAELSRLAKAAKKETDRLRAMEMVLAYAYGRPQQPVGLQGNVAVTWTVKVQAA